jgi:hypothetical protein
LVDRYKRSLMSCTTTATFFWFVDIMDHTFALKSSDKGSS